MRKKKIAAALALCMALCVNSQALATEPQIPSDSGSEQTSESGQENQLAEPKKSLVKTGYVPASLNAPPEIIGQAGIVVDMATGYTLYEKNIQAQEYPASITKIMTATLALENLKMEDLVTFSHDAVYTIEPGSSSAYAGEGEQLTVEQCLYGLMLISGNDLANGLGEAVAGSMDAFAQKMTEKAAELGCIGTQFKNAHGLHNEGHYTTAHDMAVIGINAYQQFETFRTLCSTVRYDVPPTNLCKETRYWLNNNRMLREGEEYYYADCIGGKTGFTNEAGGTLVTYANLNGRQVICVILKSTNSASAYADTITLYDYIKNNAAQADYDALEVKAAEDESRFAAALESMSNAQTTTAEAVKADARTDGVKKNSGEFNPAAKIVLALIVVFLLVYFYVSYRRFQLKQRKIARRRQAEMERREQNIQRKQLDRELEQRRKKYRNYDFSDK